jgi:hypothetical protein
MGGLTAPIECFDGEIQAEGFPRVHSFSFVGFHDD